MPTPTEAPPRQYVLVVQRRGHDGPELYNFAERWRALALYRAQLDDPDLLGLDLLRVRGGESTPLLPPVRRTTSQV